MAPRFPRMYLCLTFRLCSGMTQIKVIGPIFILGVLEMAIAGMDIIPTLTFQMLPVMKPFLGVVQCSCFPGKYFSAYGCRHSFHTQLTDVCVFQLCLSYYTWGGVV